MKSVVDIEIDVPRDEVADLFADPHNIPEWMDEVAECEPIMGEPGMGGSKYRLVSKPGTGATDFTATVIARDLPDESKLLLESPDVVVAISDRFVPPSPQTTRLISEEVFTFPSVVGKLAGVLGRRRIRQAHRRHMECFKRFAERRSAPD